MKGLPEAKGLVLVMAGFDPSGGAGVIRDCEIIGLCGAQCIAIPLSNTVQSAQDARGFEIIPPKIVLQQAEILKKSYPITHVKIGMIGSRILYKTLSGILDSIAPKFVCLDPINTSSSGLPLTDDTDFHDLTNFIRHNEISVITPNKNEFEILCSAAGIGTGTEHSRLELLAEQLKTNIILKGGHSDTRPGTDTLYQLGFGSTLIAPSRHGTGGIHGSGCIFSSALTAFSNLGDSLPEAAIKAKRITEQYIFNEK